jgi:hypothetical protein
VIMFYTRQFFNRHMVYFLPIFSSITGDLLISLTRGFKFPSKKSFHRKIVLLAICFFNCSSTQSAELHHRTLVPAPPYCVYRLRIDGLGTILVPFLPVYYSSASILQTYGKSIFFYTLRCFQLFRETSHWTQR